MPLPRTPSAGGASSRGRSNSSRRGPRRRDPRANANANDEMGGIRESLITLARLIMAVKENNVTPEDPEVKFSEFGDGLAKFEVRWEGCLVKSMRNVNVLNPPPKHEFGLVMVPGGHRYSMSSGRRVYHRVCVFSREQEELIFREHDGRRCDGRTATMVRQYPQLECWNARSFSMFGLAKREKDIIISRVVVMEIISKLGRRFTMEAANAQYDILARAINLPYFMYPSLREHTLSFAMDLAKFFNDSDSFYMPNF